MSPGDELKDKRIGVLVGGLSVEREVSPAHRRRGRRARCAGWATTWWRSTCRRTSPARLLAEKSRWPSSRSTAATARTAACRACWSRCSSPTPARGVLASSVGMEKVFAKQIFVGSRHPHAAVPGLRRPRSARWRRDSLPFPFPVVVKPSPRGLVASGVHICKTRDAVRGRGGGRGEVRRPHHGRAVRQGPRGAGRGARRRVARAPSRSSPPTSSTTTRPSTRPGSGTKYLFPAPLPPDQYERVNEVCLPRTGRWAAAVRPARDVIVTREGRGATSSR